MSVRAGRVLFSLALILAISACNTDRRGGASGRVACFSFQVAELSGQRLQTPLMQSEALTDCLGELGEDPIPGSIVVRQSPERVWVDVAADDENGAVAFVRGRFGSCARTRGLGVADDPGECESRDRPEPRYGHVPVPCFSFPVNAVEEGPTQALASQRETLRDCLAEVAAAPLPGSIFIVESPDLVRVDVAAETRGDAVAFARGPFGSCAREHGLVIGQVEGECHAHILGR